MLFRAKFQIFLARAKRAENYFLSQSRANSGCFLYLITLLTFIMHSYVLKILHNSNNVHIRVFNFLLASYWKNSADVHDGCPMKHPKTIIGLVQLTRV